MTNNYDIIPNWQQESANHVPDIKLVAASFLYLADHPQELATKKAEKFFINIDRKPITEKIATSVNPDEIFKLGQGLEKFGSKKEILVYLDIFKTSSFLKQVYDEDRWSGLILKLLHKANYTFGELFRHRLAKYGDKKLFTVLRPRSQKEFTWNQIGQIVDEYSRALFALQEEPNDPQPVAFFCKNSLEMALFDIACLSSGIVNIMIPANSVAAHVDYILQITKPGIIIISDQEMLGNIRPILNKFSFLRKVIILDKTGSDQTEVISLSQIRQLARSFDRQVAEKFSQGKKISDLATIMFTSGTTGNPKGIMFSHQNIVFKRFARAMAIPGIGEEDVFLAYLPLYHTFGRWLEMTGCIFWAASYVFMENPSVEAMLDNMHRVKPTVFISIPKKWYQLYEKTSEAADLLRDSDEKITQVLQDLTGSRLKWGISAAGHLDVEVFEFFQKYGIELMSGFGMTEATGGITMTPPGKYKPNSLGKALPGIELKFLDDGELLISGPYVMTGYVNPEDADVTFENGWLATGDIMERDADGFIRIIDRKKEIYKNIRGETIAPQKIENYFLELEFVKSVFLVGDHRPYNTLLIYPNYDSTEVNFGPMDNESLRAYFSSVIVSVNQFLSSFERIIDFRIIDRDFDSGKNELTPKGTLRRKNIESNFSDLINSIYAHEYVSVKIKNYEVLIPSWFLREKGVTQTEIQFKDGSLMIKGGETNLAIDMKNKGIRIGDLTYQTASGNINLGTVLQSPGMWLGNDNLVQFTGDGIFKWSRKDEDDSSIRLIAQEKGVPVITRKIPEYSHSLEGLHYAAILIYSEISDEVNSALQFLQEVILQNQPHLAVFAKEILRRTLYGNDLKLPELTFPILMEHLQKEEFQLLINIWMNRPDFSISKELLAKISDKKLSDDHLAILFSSIRSHYSKTPKNVQILFNLVASYGAKHPTQFKLIRQFFIGSQLRAEDKEISRYAGLAYDKLKSGFRKWLGTKQMVAVDIETGEEYTWSNVITFEEGIDKKDRNLLFEAITRSTVIREAIFLFSRGALVRLHDIPPGGVWVSLLGTEHGKSVYRVTVQTRYQGSFDLAVNLNHSLTPDQVIDEIKWLIQTGTSDLTEHLVEAFGGYWPEYQLWTEEYIPGETAGKFLRRMSRQNKPEFTERMQMLWPFFIWNGSAAYIRFWQRTDRKLELSDPSPENIIIPDHDYQTGTRIVSISARKIHKSALMMILNLYEKYVVETENNHPGLKGIGHFKYIFSGVIESFGFDHGLRLLMQCMESKGKTGKIQIPDHFYNDLYEYINSVEESGFLPKRLYFAIKRFHRWLRLNKNATIEARAATLAEMYNTYELHLLEIDHPETRSRFFADTVFLSSNKSLRIRLEKIIRGQRVGSVTQNNLGQYISALQKDLELDEDELFFVTRLSYPHLSPTDRADLISLETGGRSDTDVVVQLIDYDGDVFRVRAPVNPKEITRLQQLFVNNNLSVVFGQEHRYMIAINQRGQLIGGLFFSASEEPTVHLEKIVVAGYYRKKGVSDGLLNEFFKRMKSEHKRYVTTGFFRPEYFYRFGFKTERKYAGLVRKL